MRIGSRSYSASNGNFVVHAGGGISADILGPSQVGVQAIDTLAFIMQLSGYSGLNPSLILPNQLPSVSLATTRTILSHPQLNLWGNFAGVVNSDSCGPLEPTALQITSPAPPSAVPGEAYSAASLASGGRGGYRWNITAGTLPAGFTYSNIGILAYTGNELSAIGAYPLTLRVTDVAGNSVGLGFHYAKRRLSHANDHLDDHALAGNQGKSLFICPLAATGGVSPLS